MSPTATRPSTNNSRGFGVVLDTEMRSILPELAVQARDAPNDAAEEQALEDRLIAAIDAHGEDLSALCLSGGGIRSATFALGALQALARARLLGRFHYLSTVSGGGYIGSWLTQWRSQEPDKDVLAGLEAAERDGKQAPQIAGIRTYSNYLTPVLGLASADTWTVIALYVRNLLLNWLVFVPFFAACLLIPWLAYAKLLELPKSPDDFVGFALAGHGALCVALAFAVFGRFRMQGAWLSRKRYLLLVMAPLALCAAFYVCAGFALSGGDGSVSGRLAYYTYITLSAKGFAGIYLASWVVGRTLAGERGGKVLILDLLWWVLSGSGAGVLIGAGVKWMGHEGADCATVTVLGFSGILGVFLVADFLYAGLASFSVRGDMDREWLARASGWIAAVALLWLGVSAVALYSYRLFDVNFSTRLLSALGVGSLSGVASLLLGSSSGTAATRAAATVRSLSLTQIASIVGFIFGLTLAVLLSALLHWLTLPESVLINLVLIGILFLTSLVISWFVNINRFSLHALYRNRLVRAFLGSGRATHRDPDPFTGFDPADNPRMAQTTPVSGQGRLFHVINTALNVVSSSNPAWQERKAESFTITRQFCGNPLVRYQPTAEYGDRHGGISLGTAMAISGAAVSPNQGYSSSPLLGFLMMLFNVRLGWWLGNPKRGHFRQEGPRPALAPALKEIAGQTTDSGKWIYLSDGGHFDNLGVYEMIRRRCRFIVVCDGSCDLVPNFEGLANAVRKVYIDFGVIIEFERLDINPRGQAPARGPRCAIAEIRYPGNDRPGWLLYLKPVYQGADERADIRGYAVAHKEFPHESTTDQWFSESQLESYRALGDHTVQLVCAGNPKLRRADEAAGTLDLAMLKQRAEEYVAQFSAADAGGVCGSLR
jgi:Patatin-like phospholipase